MREFLFGIVPPNILDSGSSKSKVAVRENANVTLRCQADGFPKPNITWKREDGRVITLDRQNQGKSDIFAENWPVAGQEYKNRARHHLKPDQPCSRRNSF